MKRKKIIYGVYNLVEWHAILRMGKTVVKVPFTGGSITTQGVSPATFATSNPVVQMAIERSQEFASGKIKIVRSSPLGGEVPVERNPLKSVISEPVAETGDSTGENVADGTLAEEREMECAAGDEMCADEAEDVEDAEDELVEEEVGHKAMTQVEFSVNDDAKDYLESTFGCVRSKLRTRADIVAAGKANGVEIIFV